MAKQTLYGILGIGADATMEEILHAYEQQKQALERCASTEERRNGLAFNEYAKEHLTDPRKRALYDRKLQEAAAIEIHEASTAIPSTPQGSGSSALLRLMLLAALSGGLIYAWKHYREQPSPPPVPAPPQLAQAPAQPDAGNEVGEGLVFEPATSSNAPSRTAATAPAATVPKQTYEVQSTAVDADLVKKLVWSVYAVVGTKGFGTGVMVDSERLLTNCHVIAGNARFGKMYAINAITHDKAEITEVAYLDHQDACLIRAPGLTGQAVTINNFAQMSSEVKTHNIGFARGNLISSEGNFRGWAYRFGQKFLVSSNFCDHGVSGGPLVDDEGRLLGLTTGGPADRSYCLSVTADTISALKFETSRPIGEFPDNYTSNVSRRS
ncbi:MAG TPA: trypsin-like peptidase domain-containing protein [Rhodocyclaceae bacterium]|nr:trypsin-like peptidase domain-containing protein [Rhodocyclaceae bacterium]